MSENDALEAAVELWRHSKPESTQVYAFKSHVSKKYKLDLASFNELWQWSVDHPASFWEEIWLWTGIYSTKKYTSVGRPHSHISSWLNCPGFRRGRSYVPKASFLPSM
jgi:hypothetical protein